RRAPTHPLPPPNIPVNPPRPRHVPVIYTPEALHSPIPPPHRRPALVPPLELLGRSGDQREPPQVQRGLHPHHQPVALAGVAAAVAGAGPLPALVPRRAAVLQLFSVLFITHISHLV